MATRRHLTALDAAPHLDYCGSHGYVPSDHDCPEQQARRRHPAGRARSALQRATDRWVPNLDGTAHAAPSTLDTADGVA